MSTSPDGASVKLGKVADIPPTIAISKAENPDAGLRSSDHCKKIHVSMLDSYGSTLVKETFGSWTILVRQAQEESLAQMASVT